MKHLDLPIIEKIQFEAPKSLTVEGIPTQTVYDTPPSFGMYKSTGEYLGTVGKSYAFTQPLEILELFKEAVSTLDLNPDDVQVKQMAGGKKFSFELKLETFGIDTERVVGDKVDTTLRFLTSYDGSTSNIFQYFLKRLACLNGMTSSEDLIKAKFRHTASQDQKFKNLLDGITLAIENKKEVGYMMQSLADKKYIPGRDNTVFLKELLGYSLEEARDLESTRKINKYEAIQKNIITYTGELGNNKWAALNGVTHYTNHDVIRDDQDDYLTFKSGATLNNKAVSILV